MTSTKADKLISRGSENPHVTLAAREISEMLTRMALGQSQYFAECVERVFPDLTQSESEALAIAQSERGKPTKTIFTQSTKYFAY
ncbi:MAG: hypothetical protein WBB28_09420 [Crinalium sp.]